MDGLITVLSFISCLVNTSTLNAQIVDPLIVSGEAAPGTGLTFESFIQPWTDNTGLTIFQGVLSDGTRGIWLLENGQLTEVIRQGQSLPGASDEVIGGNAPVVIGIEDGGFALWVGLEGNGSAILMGDRNGVSTVAATGTVAPGSGELLFNNIDVVTFLGSLSFGYNNGAVVFTALIRDSINSKAANGAWVSAGGAPSLLALSDMDQFDEVDEWPEVPGHVFELKDVHIGDAGTIYARVRAVDPVAEYLVKLSEGSRIPIDIGTGNKPIAYALSSEEQLAVIVESGDGSRSVIIETSPGSGAFETVATVGEVAPGRDGNPLPDVTWSSFGRSGLGFDSRGYLYIDGTAEKNGVLGSFNRFWRRSPEGTITLHVDGSFVNGADISSPNGLALNRNGDMLLGENVTVFYQAADSETPNRIFGRGDELAVAPGDVRMINSGFLANTYFNSPGYEGRPSSLTEDPSFIAVTSFTDGSVALVRYSSLVAGLTVNSTGDGSDTDPGNGFCSTGGEVNGEAECTFRAAIEEANASTEKTTILFNIPETPPHAITVGSPLPFIVNPITITGPEYTDLPEVLIDGVSAGTGASGLVVESDASGSSIRNLWFLEFDGAGVQVSANEVTIQANVLGLDGSQLNGNGVGLLVDGDANTISDNLISGNATSGLSLRGSNNVVFNNIIGLNKEATQDLGNQADGVILLGDRNRLVENVISRNSKNGVSIVSGDANELYKNFIGTDGAGQNRLGNLENGIRIGQATNTFIGASGEGNVISGNINNGILLVEGAAGTVVLDNFIGVGANGVEGPFNVNAGVFIQDASGNSIGGIDGEPGNVIKDNEFGVVVAGTAHNNTIRLNAIYGNRKLDIDLGGDEKVTPNDLGNGQDDPDQDTGANGLINFPVGVSLGLGADNERILSGWIDVADPSNTTIDVYGVNEPHESGVGGGSAWLGSGPADSSGVFQFVVPESVDFAFYSATATSIDGATSEFSPVCGDPDGDGHPDSDRDGLCDEWEADGIDYDMDGVLDLTFHGEIDLDPMMKDLLVEVDWMENQSGMSHNHEPQAASLDRVVTAFKNAPVSNPNGETGIRLHFLKDEGVREISPIRMHSGPVEVAPAGSFDDLKFGNPRNPCGVAETDGYFGSKTDRESERCPAILGARRIASRYLIFGHQHAHSPGSSGIAELPGNDFMVTIGSWQDNSLLTTAGFRQGARTQLAQAKTIIEASTVMHEMGHTLNLKHGGVDHNNCKPNYISVMNYALQFPYMIPRRPMNYSSKALASLNENVLNEFISPGGNAGEFFLFNTSSVVGMSGPRLSYAQANATSVNWNGDQMFIEDASVDIDYIPSVGCDWQPQLRILESHDDWGNLVYDFRTALAFDDGSQRPEPASFEEETREVDMVKAAMNFDFDNDGIVNALDNCAAVSNPAQEDVDLDGIGDICEMGQADLDLVVDIRNFTTDEGAALQREYFRFIVTNTGPDSVGAVVFSDTLFTEGLIESLMASKGGCVASGATVDCTLDGLAAGDSLVVTYEMTLDNLDQISYTASVSSDAIDNNLDNNQVVGTFTVGNNEASMPNATELYQNFPNPFSVQTRIEFDLDKAGSARLVIYDLLGRIVARPLDGVLPGGHHEVIVDGRSLASGVYVYRLEVEGQLFSKRMVRVR